MRTGSGWVGTRRDLLAWAVAVSLGAGTVAVPTVAAAAQPSAASVVTAAWSASASGARVEKEFGDKYTVRSILQPAVSGSAVSVRLSNAFGDGPLQVGKVTVARTGSAAKPVTLTFGGKAGVTIPGGVRTASDSVPAAITGGRDYTVDVYVAKSPAKITSHAFAAADTLVAPGGDHAGAADNKAYTLKRGARYVLNGLDVKRPANSGVVVAFGDSITDGVNSTPNANRRYPDHLNRMLAAAHGDNRSSVVNAGISANQLLADNPDGGGLSGLNRFDASVARQPGAKTVIALFGGNDLGSDKPAQAMIDGLTRLAAKAHGAKLRFIGATITPRGKSSWYTPEREHRRQLVNDWIRTTQAFDGFVDFDKALRDPADPKNLNPSYASGDDRHPNDAGYERMARTVIAAGVR